MNAEIQPHTVKLEISSASDEDTRRWGKVLGQLLASAAVIALCGELGSGKTCFIQGIAQGLDVPPSYYVTSPSYTLINEYPGRLRLYHIDLYRIADATELEDLGLRDILYGDGVVAIEWADRMQADLPATYLEIRIDITGETQRKIAFSAHGQHPADLLIRQLSERIASRAFATGAAS